MRCATSLAVAEPAVLPCAGPSSNASLPSTRFERCWSRPSPERALASGSACWPAPQGAARRLLDPEGKRPGTPDEAFNLLHGLTWLASHLAEAAAQRFGAPYGISTALRVLGRRATATARDGSRPRPTPSKAASSGCTGVRAASTAPRCAGWRASDASRCAVARPGRALRRARDSRAGLKRAAPRSAHAAPLSRWASLTARERRVARPAAEGLREALYITREDGREAHERGFAEARLRSRTGLPHARSPERVA